MPKPPVMFVYISWPAPKKYLRSWQVRGSAGIDIYFPIVCGFLLLHIARSKYPTNRFYPSEYVHSAYIPVRRLARRTGMRY